MTSIFVTRILFDLEKPFVRDLTHRKSGEWSNRVENRQSSKGDSSIAFYLDDRFRACKRYYEIFQR